MIASAVCAIRSIGSSPRRMTSQPTISSAPIAIAPTSSSVRTRAVRTASTPVSGAAIAIGAPARPRTMLTW